MKEVNQDELFKLRDLFGKIIEETSVPITPDEAIVKFHRAIQGKYLKVFTDDLKDPKHCVVVSHMPGMVHSGFICAVNVIYSLPQYRTQASLDAMHSVIEDYARSNNCEHIFGSAWKYKGSRGIDSMWIGKGYEKQEVVYVKNL